MTDIDVGEDKYVVKVGSSSSPKNRIDVLNADRYSGYAGIFFTLIGVTEKVVEKQIHNLLRAHGTFYPHNVCRELFVLDKASLENILGYFTLEFSLQRIFNLVKNKPKITNEGKENTNAQYGKMFSIRLPFEVVDKIKMVAHEERVQQKEIILTALNAYFELYDKEHNK